MVQRLGLGLVLPTGEGWLGGGRTAGWREVRDLGRLAEDVGFDALWVADHLLFRDSFRVVGPAGQNLGIWEAWSLLGALAEATRRVTVGPFVSPVGFRNPALLAKMAATLDEVSGGRAVLGLGAGAQPPEYEAFGLPYGSLASRFEEAVSVIAPLLREGHVDFRGRYYTVRDCELRPRGPRPGGPPLLIGAKGPRMLRLVARRADMYNTVWHADPAEAAERFADLAAACGEVGRDPASIALSAGAFIALPGLATGDTGMRGTPVAGSTEQIVARLDAFRRAGVSHLVCFLDPRDRRGVEAFAPVIAALRATEKTG